jgi:hypothetical protein
MKEAPLCASVNVRTQSAAENLRLQGESPSILTEPGWNRTCRTVTDDSPNVTVVVGPGRCLG